MTTERRYLIGLAITLIIIIMGRYFLKPGELLIGDVAPEIEFIDLRGKERRLSEFNSRSVLLAFWGSWCEPCRMSNKKLVEFYQKQDTNNLVVVSVGIEKDTMAWKKAIDRDSLFWDEQFTPLQMFNNQVAESYNVDRAPEYFLINTHQKIISRSGNIEDIILKYHTLH